MNSHHTSSENSYENLSLPLFDDFPELSLEAEILSGNKQPEANSDRAQKPKHFFKTPEQYKRDFTKLFDTLTYSRDRGKAFNDWAEITAITLRNSPYTAIPRVLEPDDSYHDYEKRYLQAIKGYSREELTALAKMMAITMTALSAGKSDFVGSLCEESEIKSKSGKQWSGQFLTPYPLSKMMARVVLDETVDALIKEKGFISVDEPASGAGGMLVAVAEVLEEKLYDPSQCSVRVRPPLD